MSSKHRTVRNETARRWRANNPDKAKDTYYRYKYGITLAEYNEMFISQGGVCAICGLSETKNNRSLCVDHNHMTGEVRGLLCIECNSGIGHLKDNPQNLLNAIEYIKNNRSN